MVPAGMTEQVEARRRLLEEGARSYLKAANALTMYQQEVQKKCRRVMERHINEYGSALKVDDLKNSVIEDWAWPKFDKWEGDHASVGVRLVRKDFASIRWWEAYCTLEWQSDDPKFYCWVGEWFPSKMATDLCQEFKRLNPDVKLWDKHVGIAQALKAGEAPEFEERLEDLFQKWIKLWKKTGGMSAVFKS
jgi:hypothetical protein